MRLIIVIIAVVFSFQMSFAKTHSKKNADSSLFKLYLSIDDSKKFDGFAAENKFSTRSGSLKIEKVLKDTEEKWEITIDPSKVVSENQLIDGFGRTKILIIKSSGDLSQINKFIMSKYRGSGFSSSQTVKLLSPLSEKIVEQSVFVISVKEHQAIVEMKFEFAD